MAKFRARNMESPRSFKPVVSQIEIQTDDGRYFQSYNSMIAFNHQTTGTIYLDRNKWDYSKTTMRYLAIFLGSDATTVRQRVADGIYKLIDMNQGD